MSQQSNQPIKDIREENIEKPIGNIVLETSTPPEAKAEAKAVAVAETETETEDQGILSKISQMTDPLVSKVKSAISPQGEKEGEGEEEDEEVSVLDTSKAESTFDKTEVVLKLGDIIYIIDPTSEILNKQQFIINYIDPSKIKLINIKTFEPTQLNVKENGLIGSGTIMEIKVISRNPNQGFARQNDLIPGKWINIYFGGEYPTVITGEITNLEEDMIEIMTTDDDTLYINFAYQGIPEKLPIETFEIRPPPDVISKETEEGANDEKISDVFADMSDVEDEIQASEKSIPKRELRDKIKQFLIEGDQIVFGDAIKITEMVNIDRDKFRFNIETQSNDLLEEMVSSIPSTKRTKSVLNSIHIMITRFIQLREMSSTFDEHKNITGIIRKTADDRPLAEYLSKFQNSLYWIMLVAKNIKKVYTDKPKENIDDIEYIDENDDLIQMSTLFKNYRSNVSGEGQNKYSELYSSLNQHMTPFSSVLPDSTPTVFQEANSIIVTGNITSNINVIIDNLSDLYSSVVSKDGEITRKYVIQKYNLGLDKLEATNLKGSKMVAHRVKLTPNDNISINSILTLPEPTIRFSQINLPGSNMLVKANLNTHFLNYWQLLKQKTDYAKIEITDLETELEHENENFVDTIKNYALDLSEYEKPEGITEFDIYNHFLKIVIPKIRVIFNLVKKYIKGRLSMVEMINYLEPFLIYSNDLTYMQYTDFNKFIKEKIGEYNQKYIEYSRAFASLKTMNIKTKYTNKFFEILNNNPDIKDIVFTAYGLEEQAKLYKLSSSEFLKKITVSDYGNLFNTGVAFSNLELMYPDELKGIFEADKESIKAQMEKNRADDKCTNYVIAKKYYTRDRLEADNGHVIYFDKDFDNTNYDLIDVTYKREKDTLGQEEMMIYLTDQLTTKFKKDQQTASYMADTLVNRAKKVMNGQYAMLTQTENTEATGIEYYIRQDDEWVLATEIDPKWFIQEEDILCNIQTDCLFKPNKTDGNCESMDETRDTMVSNALTQIMDQFDKNYQISKEDFNKKVTDKARYYDNIFGRLEKMKTDILYKYNDQKYNLGLNVLEEAESRKVSPYAKLRDLIIGQDDFVKKQSDILQFVEKFCRNGNPQAPNINDGEMESEWWLYCIETNTKLLPMFRFALAETFVVNRNEYPQMLNDLKQQIGKLSANGDAWTDVHSGEIICQIDADFDEGYSEGFKAKSRDIMEQEVENVVLSQKQTIANVKKLSPDGQLVFNVIQGLSTNMGINIDQSSDFIIKVVTELMSDSKVIDKEATYREKEKQAAIKNKKMPEYGLVYSSTLMLLTLGMFLIGVQTSMPSIKTRKTFPGCVRSFSGFPFEGEGDDTGLEYVACVAHKMRSKTMPWDSLGRIKSEELGNKIKLFMVKFLLPYPEVEQKIKEKVEYLLLNPEKSIPDEHNMALWSTFLPPLRRFHVKGLQNITDGFSDELTHEIKIGSQKQLEKLLVIESKIISFSMAIQEEIQKIIEHKDLLLKSSLYPFMDNACCNERNNQTLTSLQYFVKENANIEVNNSVVRELSAVMNDLRILTRSGIMLSIVDTKRIFPVISDTFSEETIYMAFIRLCKFQSTVPMDPELVTICVSKPDYLTKNDTLPEKIAKLKRDGRTYSKEAFLRLFQVVSRNNIIRISLSFNIPSYSDNLLKLLETLDTEDDKTINRNFRQKMETLLDTFDIAIQEDTEDMRTMKNYLDRSNGDMRREIVGFIGKKSKIGKNDLKKLTTFFSELTTWETNTRVRNMDKISDDTMYNYINYYKTFVTLLSVVFPTMILNEQIHTMEVPSYWGVSQKHALDLKAIVENYYDPLKKFYGNNNIQNILYEIQNRCKGVVLLSNETPVLTNIKIKDIETYSVFDKRMATLLYEHYLLLIFMDYINLSKDPKMIAQIAQTSSKGDAESESLSDVLIEQQLRFSETEQQFIRGEVVTIQENVAKLLVAYATVMMKTKDTIDMSYDTVMDRVFKLKESEKYTFTDRLQSLTEEERAVDTILKINKLGVWSKGLMKGIKEYDPENYDQEREMTEKISEIEKKVRRNVNVTDRNADILFEDILAEMDSDAFIDADENRMGALNGDFDDGDPWGDEHGDNDGTRDDDDYE
jgi:hypothetical protein